MVIRKFFRKKRRRQHEISPDEIFAEATNVSHFNTDQFEGRIEKPIARNTFILVGIFVLCVFTFFLMRMYFLQVYKGERYAQISENNRLDSTPIFSERGIIFDRFDQKLAWNIPNVDTSDYSLREYTDMSGLAHVLGYVTLPATDSLGRYYQTNFVGKAAAEKVFNDVLTGENGTKIVETNALGDVLSEGIINDPRPGENINLSVDSRIQNKMYDVMEELANDVGFEGGAGVIIDIHTGEILSLVSYPEYNVQAFSRGEDSSYISEVLNDPKKPLLDRVVSGLYAPGSVVKPFVAVAALSEGIISAEKEIISTGSLVIPNPYTPSQPTVFKDWKAHGAVDMRKAIAVSSDVYFYEIGGGYEDQEGLGIERIEKYMRLFGFGEGTGIVLPGELSGTIPNPEWKEKVFNDEWRLGNTYHTSIGQYGFQVTPLQEVVGTAALANGGMLLEPSIIRSKGGYTSVKRIIDIKDEYLQVAREGMRLAVTDGTASGLDVSYVNIAAKTGTAELGARKDFVNSWVVGFFPYEEPKYAFAVVMENGPVDNHLGGVYVMRTLLDWMHINVSEYFSL